MGMDAISAMFRENPRPEQAALVKAKTRLTEVRLQHTERDCLLSPSVLWTTEVLYTDHKGLAAP